MNKKKFNRLTIVLIVVVLLLAIIAWALVPGSWLNHVTTPFTATYQPLKSGVDHASNGVSGFLQSVADGMEIRRHNQQLEEENAVLRQQVKDLEAENVKYQELKQALEIKDKFDAYEVKHASVMSRGYGNLFDSFTINLGASDGLSQDFRAGYAVVDADMHLVGRVSNIDHSGAKVIPLLSEGFTVTGKINRTGGAVLRVHGDLSLISNGLCLVDGIPKSAVLQPGDEVVSDGAGGLFPPGLPVGTIVEVKTGESGEQLATLQPYARIDELTDVFVLVGRETLSAEENHEAP
ncbi:MAG: rod shape-determining protein MreC [Fastidiosipilaceae bacterium]|jgi:rod shape-determining protein MreC